MRWTRCSITRVRSRRDGTTPMAVAIPTMSSRYAVCLASNSRRASRILNTVGSTASASLAAYLRQNGGGRRAAGTGTAGTHAVHARLDQRT
jgi:hypothetical protein